MCSDGTAISPVLNPSGCSAYSSAEVDFKVVSANLATVGDELTPGQTYSIVVRAWNSMGFGWASAPKTFTTKPVPEQPTNSSFSARALELSWPAYLPNGPSETPDAYNVSVSGIDRSGAPFTLIASAGAATAYNATDLVPGREYTVLVYAYFEVEGWSGGSDPTYFWTAPAAPEPPTVPVIKSPIQATGPAWRTDPSSQWIKVNAVEFSWGACGTECNNGDGVTGYVVKQLAEYDPGARFLRHAAQALP